MAAPSSPDGPAKAPRCTEGVMSCDRPGAARGDPCDLLVRSSGNTGAFPASLVVNATARISAIGSSSPICIVRQTRRLEQSARGAEVGHGPIEADPPQQALDEAVRLARRHAERQLQGQAAPDSGIAMDRLSAGAVSSGCRLL
jgi:hypothetical protein